MRRMISAYLIPSIMTADSFFIGVEKLKEGRASNPSGLLAISACLGVKNIGKPCTGKPYVRFIARKCLHERRARCLAQVQIHKRSRIGVEGDEPGFGQQVDTW